MRRAVAVLLAAALWPAAAGAQQIGVVATVEPEMRGAAPGQGARTLAIGSPIVADERVTTSAAGRGQIMFLDQTTLSISPNSEIVLDEFVYDPAAGTGRTGLRLTRGALRFIGGKTSRDTPAEIRTPTLIIGVRGSSALVTHEGGRTRAVLIAGDQLCATGGSGSFCTNRQGGILTESGYAGQVSQAELGRTLAQVDGEPVRGAPLAGSGAGGGAGGGEGGGSGGVAGLGVRGATGVRPDTDPRGAPLSSRGGQRSFEVFDEAARTETIGRILSTQVTAPPPPDAPDPLPPTPGNPDPKPPTPENPIPKPPTPENPIPKPPQPQPPEPEPPTPENPLPDLPELPTPVDDVRTPENPLPDLPIPNDGDL